jgi:hypothetical protein
MPTASVASPSKASSLRARVLKVPFLDNATQRNVLKKPLACHRTAPRADDHGLYKIDHLHLPYIGSVDSG